MEPIDRWIDHSLMSDPAEYTAAIAELPPNIGLLNRIVQGLIVHSDWLTEYGLDKSRLHAASRTTLNLSIDASDGAGISWLHRNAEVLNKELHGERFDMTVRVDETKRDIVMNRFDAVPHQA